ncbi:L-glutamate gamma-semialdehyde dehydrogenase [Neolewinella lacunae]|uniref:L-glutamate gamma-semialdehyde dehydrogenase n=1 Tax=Neolewinella lacunae TaxID=1517758 RepID=A0A923T912_9BACT|nr:L-glutamate gamma-semialdehyde dehydrogenase [Neolewinella lacunae]MBC6996220.1 L-glutamate gamma-semialdehyde dehydrogenase [Neolewinella lacunae]MDN3637177.1 L-glutamate gamma-semialdehyde dehydrogenase [Neolewinella lacunae]
MSNAIYHIAVPANEPVLSYAPNSPERKSLQAALHAAKSHVAELPAYIDGKAVFAGQEKVSVHPPHEIAHTLGHFYRGTAGQVHEAIAAALRAKASWAATPWQERAAVFLRAADLLAGPFRARMNAATMLGQSKNAYQAEIDAVAELCDFFRFNAYFLQEIYREQPLHSPSPTWNKLEYRPLEGFVLAITPFNFTSIAANLPAAPALCGNTVVWKPAETQIYSAVVIMELFAAAGLPPGVINLIYTDGPVVGDIVFKHRDFAGLHFTGSTGVFRHLWKEIGANIEKYRSYPRIVGETGGKDFIIAHPDADAEQVAVACLRGAFEYQGQKCSAASRAYLPASLWPTIRERLLADLATLKMGTVEDFSNFINAVIDERAFDKIAAYIDGEKGKAGREIIAGGGHDKSKGYFIEPTVILTEDPHSTTMEEEIFGPVLTVYVYPDADWEKALELVDTTSPYALTGAVFATDRNVIDQATRALANAAGNFYVNDKPTGAVVGQQPFGGARGSGTNDKAGSALNLTRWISPRLIKENFAAPRDYRYPFLGE